MPVYVYEVLNGQGEAIGQFEQTQRISDPPLTTHPETGQPVQRIITSTFAGGSWSEHSMHKSSRDDKKLDQLGFTKYVKSGDGIYEKRAGKGPQILSKDSKITAKDLKR